MATTYDNASLVMIPSGVKEDKLYSIKPTDGSGDFTFSRGSDIQATRVNSSGLIEKAKENLLLQSNSFDTTWLNAATTETGGQTGYDGSSDAWLLERSSAAAYLYQTIATTSVVTLSIYAKAGTLDWFLLACNGGTGGAYFNLTGAGSIGTANGIDANIESVGGDWYRCSVTSTGSMNAVRIFPAQGNGDVSGTSGNIYIQDAQLNHGLIAQDYVETTTTAVVEGLTADLPRLDYSGGASCPSLLLEPSRTNLITQSEYFGAWSGSAVYSANTTISPSGYQDAATLNDNTTGYLDRRLSASITANATHTFTFFVKKTTGSLTHYAGMAVLLTGGATRVDYGIINTTTGEINRDASSSVNSVSYSSESYGDYWRVIMTFTDNQSNTLCTSIVYPAISTNGTSISPSAQGSNVFWGAQLEAGSYPTSYIPTYGAAANRAFDSCIKTSASALFGTSEGSIFAEGEVILDTDGSMPFTAGSGSANLIYAWTRTNGAVNFDFYQGGTLQASIATSAGTLSNGDSFKMAVAYQDNDFVAYLNGTQVGTDTSGTAPNPDTFRLGGYIVADYYGSGVKQSLVFPTRLTNAELAALTTL